MPRDTAAVATNSGPSSPDGPSDVTVTITVLPAVGERPFAARVENLAHAARVVLPVALALVALGAIVATGLGGGPTRRAGAARGVAAEEKAAIAAAFGDRYPTHCLTITISASTPAFARARVNRTPACARYHGYLNASFQRAGRTWRLVRDEGQLFVPNSLLTPVGARRG